MSAPHQGGNAIRERSARANAGHRTDPSAFAADLAADRERVIALITALTPVSRETVARLDRFVEASAGVAAADQSDRPFDRADTVDAPHRRLLAASCRSHPQAKIWVDLGSGGGFPGLVIACALADTAGRRSPSGRKHRQEGELPARGGARHWRAGRSPRHADRRFCQARAEADRCRHGARAGAAAEIAGRGVSAVEKRGPGTVSQGTRCWR